ncbi:MAG: hypothetical protein ACOX6W_12015 [Lentisphaeria bacterium]
MIRAFCDSDREVIVDIANRAWMPIRRMTRQALGDKVADLLVGAAGDSRSKGEASPAADGKCAGECPGLRGRREGGGLHHLYD